MEPGGAIFNPVLRPPINFPGISLSIKLVKCIAHNIYRYIYTYIHEGGGYDVKTKKKIWKRIKKWGRRKEERID